MAGVTAPTNCSPASVSDTLRVVRWNSLAPTRASRPAMALLSAVVDIPSSVAAARKLRLRATATTDSSSFKPALRIVPIVETTHVVSSQLSG